MFRNHTNWSLLPLLPSLPIITMMNCAIMLRSLSMFNLKLSLTILYHYQPLKIKNMDHSVTIMNDCNCPYEPSIKHSEPLQLPIWTMHYQPFNAQWASSWPHVAGRFPRTPQVTWRWDRWSAGGDSQGLVCRGYNRHSLPYAGWTNPCNILCLIKPP